MKLLMWYFPFLFPIIHTCDTSHVKKNEMMWWIKIAKIYFLTCSYLPAFSWERLAASDNALHDVSVCYALQLTLMSHSIIHIMSEDISLVVVVVTRLHEKIQLFSTDVWLCALWLSSRFWLFKNFKEFNPFTKLRSGESKSTPLLIGVERLLIGLRLTAVCRSQRLKIYSCEKLITQLSSAQHASAILLASANVFHRYSYLHTRIMTKPWVEKLKGK